MRVFRIRPTIHSTIQLTSITFRNSSSRRFNKHHNLCRVLSLFPSSLPLTRPSLARAYITLSHHHHHQKASTSIAQTLAYMNQSVYLFCIVKKTSSVCVAFASRRWRRKSALRSVTASAPSRNETLASRSCPVIDPLLAMARQRVCTVHVPSRVTWFCIPLNRRTGPSCTHLSPHGRTITVFRFPTSCSWFL